MFLDANILQPLIDVFNDVIKWLHNDVGLSWGLGIVLITWMSRLVVLPFTLRSMHGMREMQALQPYMKEIQEKYKDDRQRLQRELMSFYQENKINPLASCLPLLLQLPVFMSLFFLLKGDEFTNQVRETGEQGFLFISDITEPATGITLVVLMVLFIGSQMASTMVMSMTADKTQQRIMLLLPLVFAALVPSFPAGLLVYWITTNFWTLGQAMVVRRTSPPPAPPGVPVEGAKRGRPQAAAALADGGSTGPRRPPPPPPRRKKRRRR